MIIDKLYAKYPNMTDLRAREIRVDKQLRKVFCILSYPDLPSLEGALQNEIVDYVKTLTPVGYHCSVSLVNDTFTEVTFRKFLLDYLKKNYPIFAISGRDGISIQIENRKINVTFFVDKVTKINMELAEFCEKLTEKLALITCFELNITLQLDETINRVVDVTEQEKLVRLAINREFLKPSRYMQVANVEKYIGKEILTSPMYISDIRKAMDSCVICGKISGKTLKASKKDPTMHLCKFTLTDDSQGSINCVMFVQFQLEDFKVIKETTGKSDSEVHTISKRRAAANDKKMKMLMALYDGTEVVVRGKVAFSDFSQRLELRVYDLCKCVIVKQKLQTNLNKQPPANYSLVSPEHFSEYRQLGFVDQIVEQSILKDKKVAILHFNWTGSVKTEDRILCVSAVRVDNGHVSQKFFTYINPEKPIDDKLMTNLLATSNDLVLYPTLSEIVPDLYKFLYGYEVVGKDLDLFFDFVNYYAAPVGYAFSNKTINQAELISQLFENSLITKKVNLLKLEDICKACKVTLNSSVFCGETALALAKCFAFLAENSK